MDAVRAGDPLYESVPAARPYRTPHQIYRHGRPEGSVFESHSYSLIDEAIRVADESAPGDDQARLLMIPIYSVQCIWFARDNDPIVPAVVPAAYRQQLSMDLYGVTNFFPSPADIAVRTRNPMLGILMVLGRVADCQYRAHAGVIV